MFRITRKSLLTAIVLTLQTAFAGENPPKVANRVFGICDCASNTGKTPLIELTLREDSSFSYLDFADPEKKKVYNGSWSAKGNKMYLNSINKEKSFHKKWRLESEGRCIRSRSKLNFRRICLMAPC